MDRLPDGDGVLTLASRGAYKLILFVAGWFLAGVAATVAVFTVIMGAPAHAREPNPSVEMRWETLLTDVSAIKKDMAVVKCRLNLENTCPPER